MFSSTLRRMAAGKKQPKRKDMEEENPFEELKSMMAKSDTEKEKNHLYFYADVTQDSCLDLNRKINELNKELLKFSIEYDCPPPSIFLHINSMGGDLLASFSVIDTIKNSRIPIVSIIEGNAASAATMISMVCHKRYITEHSFMLIHQLSSSCSGKFNEIQDDFQNDTKFMEMLYKLYKQHTTMPDKKIKSVLMRDIWWSSEECMENGLVDGLWDSNMTSMVVRPVHGSSFSTSQPMVTEEEIPSKRRKVRK